MKPRSVEEMWEDYSRAAGLQEVDAATDRYVEARRAFFGGLLDMFAALSEVSELGQDEADATLARWHDEFTAYATDLAEALRPKE